MRWNIIWCPKCNWKPDSKLTDEELQKFWKGTGGICQTCKSQGKKVEFCTRSFTVTSRSHRKG